MYQILRRAQGFSLVEAIVVSAVILIFFSGLTTMVIYVGDLVQNARAKLSALSAATARLEFIRSLPYDSVGTVAGIPSGTIPQNRTVTLNNYTFNERVLIEYVDDDADGLGASDSNGIIADYKRVKVEYSWNITGATSSLFLLSTVVPRSIETTAGGGTIRVNVFDAATMPVSGASVRLINTTGTSTIDVTRSTDVSGVALFAGAPANSNYQLLATKAGYSTDQTYLATTSNPNPNPAPITLLEADVSTMNFQIDRLSDLSLTVYSALTEGSHTEPFADSSGLSTSTNLTVASGFLRLAETVPGSYAASGTAFLLPVAPTPLERWEIVSWIADRPVLTDARVRFYTGSSSSYTLVPDTDLPGNSAGFTTRLVNLRGLSPTTYPELTVGITMTTTDSTATPSVDELRLWYRESSAPRSGESYTLRGNKTIGTDGVGDPVYKFSQSGTLDGMGSALFTDREWDNYRFTMTNYVLRMICPHPHPFILTPNVDLQVEALAVVPTSHHLRVVVLDPTGTVIPGAGIALTRPSYTGTALTGPCGQGFFNGLASESDYVLQISAVGFNTLIQTDQTVSGASQITVTLDPK